jgi:hypothetical protein
MRKTLRKPEESHTGRKPRNVSIGESGETFLSVRAGD